MNISYKENDLALFMKEIVYKDHVEWAENYVTDAVNNTLEFIANKRKFVHYYVMKSVNWNELRKVSNPLQQNIINKNGNLEVIYAIRVKFI